MDAYGVSIFTPTAFVPPLVYGMSTAFVLSLLCAYGASIFTLAVL